MNRPIPENHVPRTCFPPGALFRPQYMEKMHNNRYLAEKTWPTIGEWLAGKCLDDFSLVPHYAVYDFNEAICNSGNINMCAAVRMNTGINTEEISKVLNQIGTKET